MALGCIDPNNNNYNNNKNNNNNNNNNVSSHDIKQKKVFEKYF